MESDLLSYAEERFPLERMTPYWGLMKKGDSSILCVGVEDEAYTLQERGIQWLMKDLNPPLTFAETEFRGSRSVYYPQVPPAMVGRLRLCLVWERETYLLERRAIPLPYNTEGTPQTSEKIDSLWEYHRKALFPQPSLLFYRNRSLHPDVDSVFRIVERDGRREGVHSSWKEWADCVVEEHMRGVHARTYLH